MRTFEREVRAVTHTPGVEPGWRPEEVHYLLEQPPSRTSRFAQRAVFGWRDLQPLCAHAASVGRAIPNGTHNCSLCAEVRISWDYMIGLARGLHRSDASKAQAPG